MAIIKIGKVKVTPYFAISYAVSDKKDDVKDSVNYALKDKSDGTNIYKTISTPMNCSINNAVKEWEDVRKIFGKNDKILMFHIKQNFGLQVDPVVANEIGCKLANELLSNFQCIVSTHTNTPYIHNHIIFNSVSFKDGKKYYDTLNSYKKLREVSDRLCKEYGLPVIETSKDFKLVKYTGSDGKVKYFEPTERKNKIRVGKYSDTNDYRNTDAHEIKETYKKSNREVIKNDIDRLKVTVSSYEELLLRMKDVGYEVRDKKVNGDWLSHIAFRAPAQGKFTRDYKIGEEYTREKLTLLIETNKDKEKEIVEETGTNTLETSVYQLDRNSIESINDKYRKKKSNHGKLVERSEIEKLIIIDTKQKNREIDKEFWDSLRFNRDRNEPVLKNKRNQYLLDCINANLKTLTFVETKNIQSFSQINNIVKVLYEKRKIAQIELDKIRVLIKKANENIVLINNYKSLKNQIMLQRQNEDYKNFEFDSDKALLEKYEAVLKIRNLLEPDHQDTFINLLEKYNAVFKNLSNSLKEIGSRIKEYDDCVYTIKRVDEDIHRYNVEVKDYYDIKSEYRSNKRDRKDRDDR